MRARFALALCALVGCDALFRTDHIALPPSDGAPDVSLSGHDEDADGTDDAIDNCPMDLNDGADADGDSVGDACDPRPTAADRIRLFSSFANTSDPWAVTIGSWLVTADTFALQGMMGSIHALLSTPQLLVAANISSPDPTFGAATYLFSGTIAGGMPYSGIACQLELTTELVLASEAWAGGSASTIEQMVLPQITGPIQLRINLVTHRCEIQAGSLVANVNLNASASGTEIVIGARNTSLAVRAVTVYTQN